MIKLIIIDDDEMSLLSLKSFLTTEGFYVEAFANPIDALEAAHNIDFDLIASDYRLPNMNGIALISRVREFQPEIKSILFTGYYTNSTMDEARKADVNQFFAKPIRIKELINYIYKLVETDKIKAI